MIKLLKTHLQTDSGVFQSLLTVGGNMAGTFLSAIALILISRLLGPEQFGVFSVGFSISLILVRINEIGLNTAILKFASGNSDKEQVNTIFSMTLKYKLLISLAIALVGILGYRQIAAAIHFSQPVVILITFTFGLATVYFEHLLTILQSQHRFGQAVIVNGLQAGFKLLGALVLFVTSNAQVSLLYLLYVIAPAIPLLFFKWLTPPWIQLTTKLHNAQLQTKIATLVKHSSIALIAAGVIENVDILFVQRSLTPFETGLYGGVSRIALLVAMAAYSLGNVLYPRVARYKTKEHLTPYLKKATGLAAITLLGFIAFIPFAKLLIWLTIGPEYLAGVSILLILTAASFLALAVIPFVALFYSFDADWYFSVSGILQLVVVIVGNLLFVPTFGLAAAAWTRLASRLVLFAFTVITGLILYKRSHN